MWRPDYPVETEHLLLRPFTDDDFEALHDIQSRPEVTRYLYWEPRNPEAVRAALTRSIGQHAVYRQGDVLKLAMVVRASGEMIGEASLVWVSERHRQGELGYLINPRHQGHGYATEAARALLHLGFTGLGLHRMIGRCDGRNTASARVMERAGMRLEAHLRENEIVKGEWTDELIYALLDQEYTPNSPAANFRTSPGAVKR